MLRPIALLTLGTSLLLCGCPTESGGGGGDLACDAGLNKRVTCPTDPNVHGLTAVQTLQAMKDSFEVQFPGVVWIGGIAGVAIGRDGRNLDKGYTTSYGGFTMETASGWTGNFCVDQPALAADDSLNYDTSDGNCTAVRSCLAVNCNAVTVRPFPTVDTPAAIEAAFPNDPAGTYYSVMLVLDLGNYWTITRAEVNGATSETKKVDCTTGAVL